MDIEKLQSMINTGRYFIHKWYQEYRLREINKNGFVVIIKTKDARKIIKNMNLRVIDKTYKGVINKVWLDKNGYFMFAEYRKRKTLFQEWL